MDVASDQDVRPHLDRACPPLGAAAPAGSGAGAADAPPGIVLYSTSVPALPKVRGDIATIKRLLEAKRVPYEEVDLSTEPERRQAMLAGSDNQRTIPQLHVNGQFIGNADLLQEMEDFGQLDAALRGEHF